MDNGSTDLIRVVKIGGSLLGFADTKQRLLDWLASQPTMNTVWIVGGGKRVDEIREQDRLNDLDGTAVHWTCIELMDFNSRLVSSWLPSWRFADELKNPDSKTPPSNLILSPSKWVRQHASHLPCSWDVTSDSIAATIAETMRADELVLLKSADPPPALDLKTMMDSEYVDRYFETALIGTHQPNPGIAPTKHSFRVRLVNLRSPDFAEFELA